MLNGLVTQAFSTDESRWFHYAQLKVGRNDASFADTVRRCWNGRNVQINHRQPIIFEFPGLGLKQKFYLGHELINESIGKYTEKNAGIHTYKTVPQFFVYNFKAFQASVVLLQMNTNAKN